MLLRAALYFVRGIPDGQDRQNDPTTTHGDGAPSRAERRGCTRGAAVRSPARALGSSAPPHDPG
jgi:hypothetical protein